MHSVIAGDFFLAMLFHSRSDERERAEILHKAKRRWNRLLERVAKNG